MIGKYGIMCNVMRIGYCPGEKLKKGLSENCWYAPFKFIQLLSPIILLIVCPCFPKIFVILFNMTKDFRTDDLGECVMRRLVIGILAHVDAGKTTLAEGILYKTGSIRKIGRVDHKDAFLDTYELERNRGITIFSKQAVFKLDDVDVALLDTPGHVDFSAEMERTLQVLDYAILVVSGSDGVKGHTETLWRLLKIYGIPTFLFINKMDLDGTDRNKLMDEVRKRLSDGCVDFSDDQNKEVWMENIAMCDEQLLDQYIESGEIKTDEVISLIAEGKVFPCYFGSALKLIGIDALLEGLRKFTGSPKYPEQFGAKVYKIARDDQGNRLTFMKITGGSLKVKTQLSNKKQSSDNETDQEAIWEEKVDQIRIYSGSRYETTDEVSSGAVCAVLGLSRTYPGEGLGIEAISGKPLLAPILSYRIILPEGADVHGMLANLRILEEEDPQLHIVWNEQLKEIHVQLMGEVQVEILKSLILDRFGVDVEFDTGNIVYKETIKEPVIGVGHFEPLRHYAEVHLLLEPGEPGSGLIFDTQCSEDLLPRNWQRLVLTHLEEKEHVGVLTGSPITDMKITLLAGRAHQKHTEGGDFRQATYRAVRQGLKKAQNVLLEPYYNFRLELPTENLGRAMSDIQQMSGNFSHPIMEGEMSILTGSAPVATMEGYQTQVTSYTKGRGRLFCTLKGYEPCHNAEEVIEAIGYDSERDLDNPTSSVFCSHGAGFVVQWDKVEQYMHLNTSLNEENADQSNEQSSIGIKERGLGQGVTSTSTYRGTLKEDEELEAIFTRTYGPIKDRRYPANNIFKTEKRADNKKKGFKSLNRQDERRKEYLLVDGYNIIFSWDELNELAKDNMEAARIKLMDMLCNYQGFKKCVVILVFDAYKVIGGVGQVIEYNNIHVVFTKEAETADMYIEKVTHEIDKKHHVMVATSDAVEQLIIMGQGATRLSAKDLQEEISWVNKQIRRDYIDVPKTGRYFLGDQVKNDVLENYREDTKDS
mgnify:CR=1 FL=1